MDRDDILFWFPWGAGFLAGVMLGYNLATSSDPWLTLLGSFSGFLFGWFGVRWLQRRLQRKRE